MLAVRGEVRTRLGTFALVLVIDVLDEEEFVFASRLWLDQVRNVRLIEHVNRVYDIGERLSGVNTLVAIRQVGTSFVFESGELVHAEAASIQVLVV